MDEHATRITDSKLIYIRSGYITYTYQDIPFKVSKLTYELFENEAFQYVFEPYHDVIDAFEGLDIPGLDLSLRARVYYRANMTPVFISERVAPKNRFNLMEELESSGMDYYQPFLLLLDSKQRYGGDRLTLKSDDFYINTLSQIKTTKDVYKNISHILRRLAARDVFDIGRLHVDVSNRAILIKNYLFLYALVAKYYDDKSKHGKGRHKQAVSPLVLREIHKQYRHGLITIDEAVRRSGLKSRSTYYRRVKEMNGREEQVVTHDIHDTPSK
ncbi:MAG: hypothetical protein K9K93_00865 [Acholeplasmataceae bacterium]|nr:hypothetical protein [Acholeplasmataceae bacterium]